MLEMSDLLLLACLCSNASVRLSAGRQGDSGTGTSTGLDTSNIRENHPMKGGNSFSIKTTSTSLISFFVSLYFLNIISQRCNLYLQIHHCASIFRKTGIHHHSPQPTGASPSAEGRHIHIQPVLSAPGHRMLQHLPCTSVITGFHCKVSYPAIQETSLQVF